MTTSPISLNGGSRLNGTSGSDGQIPALSLPSPGLERVVSSDVAYYTDPVLASQSGVIVAFTERCGGVSGPPYASLNLAGHVGDDPVCVRQNRSILLEALGCSDCIDIMVVPHQVHGAGILVVDGAFPEARASNQPSIDADAVVCTVARTPVLLCFADCVPLIVVAPGGSFAVIHAGWRGLVATVIGHAITALALEADVPPASMNVYVGPHIGSCCYRVGNEVLSTFTTLFGEACDAGKGHLDLSYAVTKSLIRAGISDDRIVSVSLCTADAVDRFFSYRGEDGHTGRIGAYAMKGGSDR